MQIKSLLCCRYTTTSRVVALFVPLKSRHVETSFISTWFHPSVLKLEEETFGQPFRRGQETRAEHAITCWPKNDFLSSHPIGEVGIEPTASSAQDSRTTGVPHPVISCNDPCGIRTRPSQRERLTTSPEVERARRSRLVAVEAWVERMEVVRGMFGFSSATQELTPIANVNQQWAGRCSNPRPRVFSSVLHRLSYRPGECDQTQNEPLRKRNSPVSSL